ncbi:carboxylesterase family protein [Enterobacter sp. C2]|uniref:carboxylesterase/lipase family protein n=1 Tax=Enterobacter sp. C2 TaxID=2870346 RepID=UPI001CA40046|nr:carboxylesterase family protein [Enterobacter sp. C2]
MLILRRMKIMLSLILAACATCSQIAEAAIVHTQSGPVEGSSRQGMDFWEGIPFAAAPTGALRWQPPQPVKTWTRPLVVTKPAAACAQNADLGVFSKAGGQEDCLYLNVYRSSSANPQKKRPVFVWIYGGALEVGQADHYNPIKLATQGNAVIATFNYRVGVLGFYANPSLNGKNHNYANYGLMDQQAALRWVRANIAEFGGDPDNVTIAGESSGGDSVMANILSPAASGLFQHAIALSGSTLITRYPAFGASIPHDVAVKAAEDFAKSVGCTQDDANCLRALSTEQILKAQTPFAFRQFIIDGQLIPQHPADAFREGRFNNKVTLVNGGNHDEGTLFAALPELATGNAMTEDNYAEAMKSIFGEAMLPAVLKEYPAKAYNTPSEAFSAAAGDSLFSCPVHELNNLIANKLPLYAYEFSDQTAPMYTDPVTFPLMASHTSELSYLFPGFHGGADKSIKLNSLQEKLSDEMVTYFSHLAALKEKQAVWPQYDPDRENYMTFVLPASRMISGRFSQVHHCDFWKTSGIF